MTFFFFLAVKQNGKEGFLSKIIRKRGDIH